MKALAPLSLSLSLALLANPAFAHSGLHLHPHADSSSWVPLLAGSLAIGTAGLIAWMQR